MLKLKFCSTTLHHHHSFISRDIIDTKYDRDPPLLEETEYIFSIEEAVQTVDCNVT